MRDIVLYEILIPSLIKLYETDFDVICASASERCICARLAHHIENTMRLFDKSHESHLFDDYFADVEYNRMGCGHLKHIMNQRGFRQYIVSDLLIQTRGAGRNLLAAELKRKGYYKGVQEDRDRLKSLASSRIDRWDIDCVYDTLLGAFIVFSQEGASVELYEAVNGIGEKTGAFRVMSNGDGGWGIDRRGLR